MKYYNELQKLICEFSDIKKDLEELRSGCGIIGYNSEGTPELQGVAYVIQNSIFTICGNKYNKDNVKIIGNYIEERHIRIYCEYKNIKMTIFSNGDLFINNTIKICKLDNSVPFHKQKENIYEQITMFFRKR